MEYKEIAGVPEFEVAEFHPRRTKYCLIIPVLNEENNIFRQLKRAQDSGVDELCDIVICDGNSTDKTNNHELLKSHGVNTLLIKKSAGRQGAQLRMGFWWAIERGYEGIITIDGNNKDGIEKTGIFVEKLAQGYDFVQGSRFLPRGEAINTPLIRKLSVKLIHSPIISLTAKKKYTDSTNNFRAYSINYLTHERVQLFRDIFSTYELLAYLSVRASQLDLKCCEVPVRREYPKEGKIPTKISFIKGNSLLLSILFKNLLGLYRPSDEVIKIRKKLAVVCLALFLLMCTCGMLLYSNFNNQIIIKVSDSQPKILSTDNRQRYQANVYFDKGDGYCLQNTVHFYANETVSIAYINKKANHTNFVIVVSGSETFAVEKLTYINKRSKRTDLTNAALYPDGYFEARGMVSENGALTANSPIIELSPQLKIKESQINDSLFQQNIFFYFCAAAAVVSVLLMLINFNKSQFKEEKITKWNK